MLTQIKTVPATWSRFIEGSPAPDIMDSELEFALVNRTKAKKIGVLLYFIIHRNPHLLYA